MKILLTEKASGESVNGKIISKVITYFRVKFQVFKNEIYFSSITYIVKVSQSFSTEIAALPWTVICAVFQISNARFCKVGNENFQLKLQHRYNFDKVGNKNFPPHVSAQKQQHYHEPWGVLSSRYRMLALVRLVTKLSHLMFQHRSNSITTNREMCCLPNSECSLL